MGRWSKSGGVMLSFKNVSRYFGGGFYAKRLSHFSFGVIVWNTFGGIFWVFWVYVSVYVSGYCSLKGFRGV